VSAAPISDSPVASDVLIAQTVLDRLNKLAETDPAKAEAVARAIQTVGQAPAARPIRIDLPNGPPGAKYMALASSDPDAPVIIYRALIPGVDSRDGWLVTALLPPVEYRHYREAESTGLLDDPAFQKLMMVGAAALLVWLLSRSGKPQGA
jgi:hypothetical protein